LGLEKVEEEMNKENKNFDVALSEINWFTDDVDLSRQFHQKHPFFYDKNKMWWRWNENDYKYDMIDEVDLMVGIDKSLGTQRASFTTKTQAKSSILEALKRVGRVNIPKPVGENWVQFKEKIIDVKSGIEYKATPEYFNVNPIPWELGDTIETPFLDKIFTQWVGADYIKTLYEIIAYSMLQSYPIHRLFCFVGSGSNGKTVYLKFLKRLIGPENNIDVELDELLDRFGTAPLYKKLVCTMGETNVNKMRRTSIIKKLCDGSGVKFEFKGKNAFSDESYATIIIATNTLPTTEDKTDGFYRRWCIIKFPNKFTEEKDILNEIPGEEYNNLCLKSVGILRQLLIDRKFHKEGTIEERKEKYEENSNPLRHFIEEFCILDDSREIAVTLFYSKFSEFLNQRGYRDIHVRAVSQSMSDEYGISSKYKVLIVDGEKKNWKHYYGIDFKNQLSDFSIISKVDKVDKVDDLTSPLYMKQEEIPTLSTLSTTTSQETNVQVKDKAISILKSQPEWDIELKLKPLFPMEHHEILDKLLDMMKTTGMVFFPRPGFVMWNG